MFNQFPLAALPFERHQAAFRKMPVSKSVEQDAYEKNIVSTYSCKEAAEILGYTIENIYAIRYKHKVPSAKKKSSLTIEQQTKALELYRAGGKPPAIARQIVAKGSVVYDFLRRQKKFLQTQDQIHALDNAGIIASTFMCPKLGSLITKLSCQATQKRMEDNPHNQYFRFCLDCPKSGYKLKESRIVESLKIPEGME